MPEFAVIVKEARNRTVRLSCNHVVSLLGPAWDNIKLNDMLQCPFSHEVKHGEIERKEEPVTKLPTVEHGSVNYSDGKGYKRNGSPFFYRLLDDAANIHDKKSHDYASNDNPFGNYYFAGQLSKLFDSPHDAGFVSRIAEKLYRLANMENSGKQPKNESVEDTEIDLVTIMALWMASRKERRDTEMRAMIQGLGTMKGTGG